VQLDIYSNRPQPLAQSPTFVVTKLLAPLVRRGVDIKIRANPRTDNFPAVSLMHVDLTELPSHFAILHRHHQHCLNGHVHSIAKPRYSSLAVGADQRTYRGPVIVKTRLNHRGLPELRARVRRGEFGPAEQLNWPQLVATYAPPYQVFADAEQVPQTVWDNPRLFVERFAPGSLQLPVVKYRYNFFLDQSFTTRAVFNSLLCEADSLLELRFIQQPAPELLAIREKMQLDFGAIDYFVTASGVSIIDVNKTAVLQQGWVEEYRPVANFINGAAAAVAELVKTAAIEC